jgi:hypothetical protein
MEGRIHIEGQLKVLDVKVGSHLDFVQTLILAAKIENEFLCSSGPDIRRLLLVSSHRGMVTNTVPAGSDSQLMAIQICRVMRYE